MADTNFDIDTGGTKSYTTWNAAIIAAAASSGGGNRAVFRVSASGGAADTTAASVAGLIAAGFISWLVTPLDSTGEAGSSFNSGKYAITNGSGHTVSISDGPGEINNIQIENTDTGITANCINAATVSGTLSVHGCFLRTASSANSHLGINWNVGFSYALTAFENYILCRGQQDIGINNQADSSLIQGNTIYFTNATNTSNKGIVSQGNVTVQNNVVGGNTTTCWQNVGGTVTEDHNAGVDATFTGTGSLQNKTDTDFAWTTAGTDFSLTSSSVLIDVGATVGTYSQASPYDIGAFEYIAGGSTYTGNAFSVAAAASIANSYAAGEFSATITPGGGTTAITASAAIAMSFAPGAYTPYVPGTHTGGSFSVSVAANIANSFAQGILTQPAVYTGAPFSIGAAASVAMSFDQWHHYTPDQLGGLGWLMRRRRAPHRTH